MMTLSFLGAAHEVTGSCFYLEAAGARLLIDCGLRQGPEEYLSQELPQNPAGIDAVLLTHAHIDHSGRLPLLYARGYRAPIHATGATCDLCDIMLRDSAHIQMFEAEWRNRKGRRAGWKEYIPLYDMDDAVGAIGLMEGHGYGEGFAVCPGISARFYDAGHLLGSASVELTVEEEGRRTVLLFSGDIGNTQQPLVRDPQIPLGADYVVMESTYGERLHDRPADYVALLAQIIGETFARGGSVVIPSFAVGRTQELLYFLRTIKERGLVERDFPVYVDSPLAIEATNVFQENRAEYFDEEALALCRRGVNPLAFPGLRLAVSSDESRAINADESRKVILSASGMCEAGRIKHHLKHNLWQRRNTILFVGYQAQGTLGRALLEGAKTVRLFGEEVAVEAEIRQFPGISAHADREGLLRWVRSLEKRPRHVFVVHGADSSCEAFTELLRGEGFEADAPYPDARFDLEDGVWLSEGTRVRHKAASPERPRPGDPYTRLTAAGERLQEVIRRNQGGANKDLAKLCDQINALCEKWNR